MMIKFYEELISRASRDRMQIERIGIGQLHWSTANYAPPQELALWGGLVAMYEKIQFSLLSMGEDQMDVKNICDSLGIRLISYHPLGLGMLGGKYTHSRLPSGPRTGALAGFLKRNRRKTGQNHTSDTFNGTIPIPGVKTVRQAEGNLGALSWRLSSNELASVRLCRSEVSTEDDPKHFPDKVNSYRTTAAKGIPWSNMILLLECLHSHPITD
ncbi:pyridoxal reductase, chloroplastic-like [Durio zibethinus]|uniref:Pyridoxal reductase, chloroplastic-like n=1 Tax=Durio zibethinus TaxID=66656 RepID=A0A6P5YA78_DURZI|nr:pyridoxal reductase, chloroplastic-like [Durio zibethinus]